LVPALRVDEGDQAGVGQVHLRRVDDLDPEQLVSLPQATQRPHPVVVAEEVRDHRDLPAPSRRPAGHLQRQGQVAAASFGRPRCGGHFPDEVAGVRHTGAGRDPVGVLAGGHDRADPVAATRGQVDHRGQRCVDELTLLGARGADVQARRKVDDGPRLEFAVGDGLTYVRHGRACGHRPVHPAHVVAGVVEPRLGDLRARPRDEPEVVALQ
jgi:hypothetical protein